MLHATRFKILAAIFLLSSIAAIFFARNSGAQEGKPPALPLPEMQKLSRLYAGTWTYTETYPKSPMFPNGGENTGFYTSELGPGGNSIFNHFHSKGPVGEFDGTIVMTWDPKEKLYKAYVFGDSFPSAVVETGQWENDALVYRFELAMGPTKIALRNVTKFLPDGKLTSEEFTSVNGAAETLFVHVAAVKK
ncbi:MAG TPA: hypothetical protein VNX66_06230 [Candidatus Sulfotelmatobacter sp.]|jgi:hypothetical protein|nr:hypothetical protein [Candidatus Sulfotelmatobacter sp.]